MLNAGAAPWWSLHFHRGSAAQPEAGLTAGKSSGSGGNLSCVHGSTKDVQLQGVGLSSLQESVSKKSLWSQDRKKQKSVAMDFSSQGSINEQVICRICQQLLTEPMSLHCGHNFCQLCIAANESESFFGGHCRCPVCQSTYDPWTPHA
ncbi:Tripartite motif-containing protein 5 [Myotis brandtii]|uniref:Tripartite motif-containing protein 5 n=1 Tax=Myotis brandtii TaxID=109478 RepID=S7MJ88_MYOBR|nr:Tripartite motif-containing protein 5 [Myotis brandtii]